MILAVMILTMMFPSRMELSILLLIAVNVIDWKQTVTIAKNPERWQEVGLIASRLIGNHPSVRGVHYYFIGSALIQAVIVAACIHITIDSWMLILALAAGRGFVVFNNLRLGI